MNGVEKAAKKKNIGIKESPPVDPDKDECRAIPLDTDTQKSFNWVPNKPRRSLRYIARRHFKMKEDLHGIKGCSR